MTTPNNDFQSPRQTNDLALRSGHTIQKKQSRGRPPKNPNPEVPEDADVATPMKSYTLEQNDNILTTRA